MQSHPKDNLETLRKAFGLGSFSNAENKNQFIQDSVNKLDVSLIKSPNNIGKTELEIQNNWNKNQEFKQNIQEAENQKQYMAEFAHHFFSMQKNKKMLDEYKNLCSEKGVENYSKLMDGHANNADVISINKQFDSAQKENNFVDEMSNSYTNYNRAILEATMLAINEKYTLDDMNDEQAAEIFKAKTDIIQTLGQQSQVINKGDLSKTPFDKILDKQEQTYKDVQNELKVAHQRELVSNNKTAISPQNNNAVSSDNDNAKRPEFDL